MIRTPDRTADGSFANLQVPVQYTLGDLPEVAVRPLNI